MIGLDGLPAEALLAGIKFPAFGYKEKKGRDVTAATVICSPG